MIKWVKNTWSNLLHGFPLEKVYVFREIISILPLLILVLLGTMIIAFNFPFPPNSFKALRVMIICSISLWLLILILITSFSRVFYVISSITLVKRGDMEGIWNELDRLNDSYMRSEGYRIKRLDEKSIVNYRIRRFRIGSKKYSFKGAQSLVKALELKKPIYGKWEGYVNGRRVYVNDRLLTSKKDLIEVEKKVIFLDRQGILQLIFLDKTLSKEKTLHERHNFKVKKFSAIASIKQPKFY